jgi:hypothetical protein
MAHSEAVKPSQSTWAADAQEYARSAVSVKIGFSVMASGKRNAKALKWQNSDRVGILCPRKKGQLILVPL